MKCTECGGAHRRHHFAIRCWPCTYAVEKMRRAASNEVNKAVRKGTLQPAKAFACVDCGKPAYDYDHRDYRRPLDVVPVCRSCNLKRGPALWRDQASLPTSASC